VSWPPHITVAAIVQRNDHFLMVEEFDNGRRVINQPAGHLEPGESLFDAVLRETLEETGWIVALQHFVGVYQYYSPHNEVTYHRLAFTAGPVEQSSISIDPDIAAVHWLTLEEIKQREARSPLVLKCIDDAMNNPGLPLETIKHFLGNSPKTD
jgi:8-oxo-dGTP pyrophosphatase MutT (NUDIX family)